MQASCSVWEKFVKKTVSYWKWKGRGVKKQATVRIWFRTMAIEVCLIFIVAVVFSSTYFRFLFVKLLIGDWRENRRGARSCLVRHFSFFCSVCQLDIWIVMASVRKNIFKITLNGERWSVFPGSTINKHRSPWSETITLQLPLCWPTLLIVSVYSWLINYIDTKAKCHLKQFNCKGT